MKCIITKKHGMNKLSFSIVIKTIRYLLEMSSSALFIMMLISLINAAFQGVGIYAYQNFFDSLVETTEGGNAYGHLIKMILIISLIECSIILVQFVFDLYCKNYVKNKLYGFIKYKAHQKMTKIDMIHFEETDLFEQINKAVNSIENGVEAAINTVIVITYYIPYFIIMLLYFGAISPSVTLILVGTFIPVAISNVISSKVVVKNEEKIVSYRRQAQNYQECMVKRSNLVETRHLGAFGFFYHKYLSIISKLNNENWVAQKKVFASVFLSRLIRAIGFSFVFIVLFLNLKSGLITLGVFGSVYITIEKINGIAAELVGMLGDLQMHSQKARFFYDFLNMPEKNGRSEEIDKDKDICLEHVSFQYPGSGKTVLEDINVTIKKGETVAIVGENGAGKTTLSKLLLGLYTPTTGTIRMAGKDISEYDYQSVTHHISAVFQNYQRYKMPLKDNITISCIENVNHENPSLNIKKALESTNVPIESDKFTKGLDTMLSREFGGVEMSGGEWQRIAIARGIYRIHDFIVLDEPTSAIDPLEESQLYHIFQEIAKGKTMIIITHRLGAARLANRILVMEKGQIIEDGSHEELIDCDSQYRRYWHLQKKWYQ